MNNEIKNELKDELIRLILQVFTKKQLISMVNLTPDLNHNNNIVWENLALVIKKKNNDKLKSCTLPILIKDLKKIAIEFVNGLDNIQAN